MAPKDRNVGLNITIAGDPRGASKAFKTVSVDATSLTGKLKTLATGAGAFFAGQKVIQWGQDTIKTYRSVGGEIVKLERLTGSTTDQAAGLYVAAQQSGVPVAKLANSIGLLSSKLNNKAVAQLGIDLRNADGSARPFNDVLRDIMDKFASMENGTEKNLLARQLFGRAGTDLIPLLNKGGAALDDYIDKARELGIAINSDDIKEATRNQRDYELAMTATKVVIGKELLPVATKFTGFLARNLPTIVGYAVDGAHAFGSMPAPIKAAVVAALGFGPVVKLLSMVATPVRMSIAAVQAGKGSFEMFRYGLAGVSQEGAGAANSLGMFINRLGGLGPAALIGGGAIVGLAAVMYEWRQEQKKDADAARELSDAIDGIVDSAVAAGESIPNVFRDERLPDFARDFGAAMDEAGISITDVQRAISGSDADFQRLIERLGDLKASDIGDDARLSDQSLVAGLIKLRQEYTGATAGARKQKDAQKELGSETGETAGATELLAGSQEQLVLGLDRATSAVQSQYEKLTRLRDLQTGVATAHENTEQAVADLATAERAAAGDSDEYRSALEAERDALDAIPDAAQAVTDARQSAADAVQSEADAIYDLGQTRKSELAAIADERQAVEDLAAANARLDRERQDAILTLEQLAQKVTDARLAESQAAIDTDKAAIERRRANAGLRSDIDRRQAEQDYQEALAAQREAATNRVLAERENNRVGGNIENVDGVVSAREDVERAEQTLADRRDAVTAASRRTEQAERAVESARRGVEAANRGVEQAEKDLGRAHEEAAAAGKAAAKILTDAKETVKVKEKELQKTIEEEAAKWAELAGQTGGATGAVYAHLLALDAWRNKIRPGSDLYNSLTELMQLLGGALNAAAPTGLPALGPSAPPGAANAERRDRSATEGVKSGGDTYVMQGTPTQQRRAFAATAKRMQDRDARRTR